MNEKVNFDDFVEQVALESGYDYDTAKEYVERMFETIVEESTKGRWVKIRKFGSFQPRWYKAKRGVNPQTGEALDILPHYHIHFAASKALQEHLNSGRSLTPIELEEPSTNIFQKLAVVILVALLAAWIYKTWMAPQTTTPVFEPQPEKVVPKEPVTPKVEPKALMTQTPQRSEPIMQEESSQTEISNTAVTSNAYPGTHKVMARETLSQIGLAVYKDTRYWPLLLPANADTVKDPDHILKGMLLNVPDISEGSRLYDAYVQTYRAYLAADKMGRSFWVLCNGHTFFKEPFMAYLKKRIDSADYAIVQKCRKE